MPLRCTGRGASLVMTLPELFQCGRGLQLCWEQGEESSAEEEVEVETGSVHCSFNAGCVK